MAAVEKGPDLLADVRAVARTVRMRRALAARQQAAREEPDPPQGGLLDLVAHTGRFRRPDHLAPIAEHLERALRDRVEICVSVPPRHGKTTLILHAIAWWLLQDPTATILYCSYAFGFSRLQIEQARKFALELGVVLGGLQRSDEWHTRAGGRVKAVGIGGQITGEGFRIVVVDDPHKSRAEAESRRIREGVVNAFLNDIYTRQDPRGTSTIVVHTRWHEHDLIGVLTRPGESAFTAINLPALDADGKALAPWLFDEAALARIRARIGEYAWSSLYEGHPRPRGGTLFTGATIADSIDPLPSQGYQYVIGIDLAHTARTRADWSVAVVMRRSTSGEIAVVDVVREQALLTDVHVGDRINAGFLRRLYELTRQYQGARVVWYAARDEALVTGLAASHREYPVHIETMLAVKDKWTRAQPYASRWNDPEGGILIPRGAPWADAFIEEHLAFSGSRSDVDDQVDAAAAAYDALMASSAKPIVALDPAKHSLTRPRIDLRRKWT